MVLHGAEFTDEAILKLCLVFDAVSNLSLKMIHISRPVQFKTTPSTSTLTLPR